MKKFLAIAFFALSIVGTHAQTHSGEVVRIVNRLRAADGACATTAPPFVSRVAFSVNAASTMGVYWVQLFGAPR